MKKNKNDTSNNFCIDDILHLQCQTAKKINIENCMQIIRDNENTAYGKAYGFGNIQTVDDFRSKVPINDYETHRPYINKMMKGDDNQLTVYPVAGYCHTSGTLGKPKYIPMTSIELHQYNTCMEKYQDECILNYGGKRLHLNAFRTMPGEPTDKPLLFTEIYYKNLYEQGLLKIDTFVAGDILLFTKQPGDIFFAKLWAALLEEHITIIESVFMYDQLCFFSYFEEHWQEVLYSIRNHFIPEGIELSENIRKYLLSLPVSSERLLEIEQECSKGFDNIAKRIWHNLRLISGISSKTFFSEDIALNRYVSDISKYYLCYGASECYMGYPIQENSFQYVLMPGHAFFEFLPYDENDKASDTYLPHEVEAGKQYEIVYTTFTGLYRYRMGDVVTITGFYGESPIMEFSFRRNQLLNIAGEKMSIIQIENAIQKLSNHNIMIEQYCFGASLDYVPCKYIGALVPDSSTAKNVDSGYLSSLLDKLLQDENEDYKDLRALKRLNCLEVKIFDNLSFPVFLQKNGLSNGHNKPKHIASIIFSERN